MSKLRFMNDKNYRFRKLGGTYQLIIENGQDIRNVIDLDQALWAVTSIQTKSMICDPEFLSILDADNNGRIRQDEVRTLLRWILEMFCDYSGLVKGSDVLALKSLNENNPEAAAVAASIRLALQNIGNPDDEAISMQQLCDNKKIVSNSLQNGDGIITPDAVSDTGIVAYIKQVITCAGSHKDVSGADGISIDDLTQFENNARNYLAWVNRSITDRKTIFPFGEKTKDFFTVFSQVEQKVNEFFRSCESLNYMYINQAKLHTIADSFDPLDTDSVESFLDKSLIADINQDGILFFNDRVNPLWRDKLHAFFTMYESVGGSKGQISYSDWKKISQKISQYSLWLKSKNTDVFDGVDLKQLKKNIESDIPERIRQLMNNDLAVSQDLKNCIIARKLLLCQKNILEFLNNFVCLHKLFEDDKNSMIQAGKLVMDGRNFTLCTVVHDIAEHKVIAKLSNICVMYLDISTGIGSTAKSMKLAVGITSGHMRNIFIGKTGVFVTADGVLWDAKVIDLMAQPVSFREALCSPFLKFTEFMQKQIDKFFSAKSKAYETSISSEIDKKTVQPAAQSANTPNGSLNANPMLLMSGGIGLAALGSAFAFITKSLASISIISLLSIILGILIIFGGPIVTSSLLKLYKRNLGIFLEANGYALNHQMRLSLQMGRVFTYSPKLPKASVLHAPVQFITSQKEGFFSKLNKSLFVFLILTIILYIVSAVIGYCFAEQCWNFIIKQSELF